MLRLPVIDNATALVASVWADYVEAIYGPLRESDFPIDLRSR